MPMAASIAKWGATVSASWSTSQCADDPALRHAVHLPLTVGHPLWVILVDSDISAACPLPTHCTRGCGCGGHPAFPTPLFRGEWIKHNSGAPRREVGKVRLPTTPLLFEN